MGRLRPGAAAYRRPQAARKTAASAVRRCRDLGLARSVRETDGFFYSIRRGGKAC